MPPFLQNLLALPAKTKAVLGVSAVAILAIAFIMLKIATAPSYALIASGLDPAETGKITAALDEQGIGYELRNNGTALAVQKSATAQARIALAGQGVQTSGGGSQPGYELLDESKLGASQFQQQVTYQRALEGEVAKSMSGVEGVSNPNVQIVMPQDDLFADEASPATAAIQLGNASDTLAPGAVRGMAQLTASSVKGLKTDNVTITDSTRRGPVAERRGRRHRRRQLEQGRPPRRARRARRRARSTRCSASTLGPGKAQVKINADLNMDETTEDELTYGGKGTPLKTTEETENLKGGGAASRRRGRHGLQRPDLLGQRTAPAARQQHVQVQEGHDRVRRPQEGDQDQEGRRRASTSSTSRCWSTSRSRRRSSTRSRRPSARPPASTPPAATRCRPPRWPSPSRPRPRRARCRRRCSGR